MNNDETIPRKVFVLMGCWERAPSEVLGVFRTPEDAHRFAREHEGLNPDAYDHYTVVESGMR